MTTWPRVSFSTRWPGEWSCDCWYQKPPEVSDGENYSVDDEIYEATQYGMLGKRWHGSCRLGNSATFEVQRIFRSRDPASGFPAQSESEPPPAETGSNCLHNDDGVSDKMMHSRLAFGRCI